jgi:hypothetical protein
MIAILATKKFGKKKEKTLPFYYLVSSLGYDVRTSR